MISSVLNDPQPVNSNAKIPEDNSSSYENVIKNLENKDEEECVPLKLDTPDDSEIEANEMRPIYNTGKLLSRGYFMIKINIKYRKKLTTSKKKKRLLLIYPNFMRLWVCSTKVHTTEIHINLYIILFLSNQK